MVGLSLPELPRSHILSSDLAEVEAYLLLPVDPVAVEAVEKY
jgi:hypothetical protein